MQAVDALDDMASALLSGEGAGDGPQQLRAAANLLGIDLDVPLAHGS